MFKVLVEEEVLCKIESLPGNYPKNIKTKLKGLEQNPFPDGHDKKEIKGSSKTAYRLRIGDYRIFYIIDFIKKEVKITEFMTAEQAHKKYGLI